MSNFSRRGISNDTDLIRNQIKTSNLSNYPPGLPLIDSRFVAVNQAGHTTILDSTFMDVNDTGNLNWLPIETAETLYVVSDSTSDAPAGSGVFTILIQGLDVNLDPIIDVVVVTGTTQVATNIPFRAVNLSIALAGGTPGSGAAGNITISTENSATPTVGSIWAKYIINDTGAEVGRYTIPNGKRLEINGAIFNGGNGADMTVKLEVTTPGGFPIALGDNYINTTYAKTDGLGSIGFDAGTLIKFRAFTNSGNPSQRKLAINLFGVLADIEDWNLLKQN